MRAQPLVDRGDIDRYARSGARIELARAAHVPDRLVALLRSPQRAAEQERRLAKRHGVLLGLLSNREPALGFCEGLIDMAKPEVAIAECNELVGERRVVRAECGREDGTCI